MEEFNEFKNILLSAAPFLAETYDDEYFMEMFEKIKKDAPGVTSEQLKNIIPQIVPQIVSKLKVAPEEGIDDKLAALQSLGG